MDDVSTSHACGHKQAGQLNSLWHVEVVALTDVSAASQQVLKSVKQLLLPAAARHAVVCCSKKRKLYTMPERQLQWPTASSVFHGKALFLTSLVRKDAP